MKKRRLWLILPALAAALAAFLFFRGRSARPEPCPSLLLSSDNMDLILADAVFSPEDRSLSVSQTLFLHNRTGKELNEVILRAFPNAYASAETSPGMTEELRSAFYPEGFSTGGLSLREVRADGGSGAAVFTDEAKTVLSVPVVFPPDSEIMIAAEYTVYLPRAAASFGAWDGVYSFGDVFLVPAWYDGAAYREDPLLPWGGAPWGDCADWTVSLAAPAGYQAAAPAAGEKVTLGGETVWHFNMPAARSFAFSLSREWKTLSRGKNGVRVTALGKTAAGTRKLLRTALAALDTYSRRFGAYPYPSFTICETAMEDEGAAYPGLVMASSPSRADAENTLARLCAMEWWGAAVGCDTYDQSWMREALAEYSLLLYLRDGRGSEEEELDRAVRPAGRLTFPAGQTPGAPLDAFTSRAEYRRAVREKGAGLFLALDELLGGRTSEALAGCYEKLAFTVPGREEFETVFSLCAGEDIHPLMLDYLDTDP